MQAGRGGVRGAGVRGAGRQEAAPDSGEQVGDVHVDIHEDVQAGQARDVDGDQAGVAVVDEKVRPEGKGAVVIHTAGPESHLPHYEAVLHAPKPAQAPSTTPVFGCGLVTAPGGAPVVILRGQHREGGLGVRAGLVPPVI